VTQPASGGFESRLGAWLAAWVTGAARRPFLVIVATALLLTGSSLYGVSHLAIEGSTDALFSPDLPFKRAERRYYEAFPTQFENMFIVVDAVSPERAGQAAAELAEHLRARPDTYNMVYLPGGGSFFERNAFLYLGTDELEELADRLAEAQPYLAELSKDGTLRGLASILARGARATRDGDFSGDQLAAIFDRFSEAVGASLEGRSYHLSWAEVIADREFESDPRRRVLLVQPVLRTDDIQPARHAIEAVHRAIAELGLEDEGLVRVRITGDVALSYEEMGVVKNQAAAAGVASFVLVALILSFGLRSARLVLSALTTLVVGLLFTAGYTAVAVGRFNMISVAFAVLFIGLGVDFGIHFCMRYRERLAGGIGHLMALDDTARDVGSSLALCALTTAIGFFAFAPTPFVGVAELGIISGGGMIISLITTLTLLPALLSVPPLPGKLPDHSASVWSGRIVDLPVRFPRVVRGAALLLGIGSVTLLPQARFDNNPLNVRDPSSESVKTLRELLENGARSPWSLNALMPDLASARQLAEELRALPSVERVVTLADFVPAEQDEKLSIIEDLSLFLAPLESGGDETRVPLADQVAQLEHLRDEARKLVAEEPASETGESAAALAASLDGFLATLDASAEAGSRIARLEESLLGSLPEQLRILDAALGAGRVSLENLPDALLAQMQAEDGRARVQIFPRHDLSDHAALAAFYDSVEAVVPGVTGSAAEMVASGRTVVAALQQALLSALVAVTLVVFLLWRRVTDTALVLLPLALASSLTVAAAVLLSIPFNFADVIVLPLLLGIGVDSGIHLVHRARVSGDVTNLLGTSTARAVGYSALTTIASFGTMGFASHLGLATLGQLLTLGVAFTLLCNLVVLPAVISLSARPALTADLSRSTRTR
jgi:hopanoid biosynthesis associated RND transporter like protein HpnN